MKVNIENCLNQATRHSEDSYKYVVSEFIENLKALKERNDKEALKEFFDCYTFSDG